MTDHDPTDPHPRHPDTPPPAEWQDVVAMIIAAFQVLWAPVALMLGGFVLVYVIAWLWLRVF